jgi:hypothetical protein
MTQKLGIGFSFVLRKVPDTFALRPDTLGFCGGGVAARPLGGCLRPLRPKGHLRDRRQQEGGEVG